MNRITNGRFLGWYIWSRGMSIKEVAPLAGMSPSHLSNIIYGRARLTPGQAEALSRVIGTVPYRLQDPNVYFQVRRERESRGTAKNDS